MFSSYYRIMSQFIGQETGINSVDEAFIASV